MKVCRVSQTYPTQQNNGKGLHCYHVSRIQEIPTLILTKNYGDEDYWPTPNNVTLRRVTYWQKQFPMRNSLSLSWLLALLSFVVGQFQFLFGSIPALYRFKPTITHLQSPHAILIGIFNKLFFKAPILLTFHGSDLLRVKNNKYFHLLLKWVDVVLYVNPTMKTDLDRIFGATKLIHSPSGVDLDFFNTQSVKQKKQLVAVGNLRWQKGYEYLLQSFQLFNRLQPDYCLLIIGEGEDKSKLEQLACDLGISEHITFYGRASTEQVRNALSESELFVISSVAEGMPKAILEALACSLPIVSTDVGACRELSQDVGLCVDKQEPEKFSKAINQMITDTQLYEKCVQNCRRKAENYSWNALSRLIIESMKKIESTK